MRIFRTEAGYAVDDAGRGCDGWSGDLFGEWEAGEEIPGGLGGGGAGAGRAEQDRRGGAQLQGHTRPSRASRCRPSRSSSSSPPRPSSGPARHRAAAGRGRVDHEAEMGVVIGRRARVPADRAAELHPWLDCVNDVTARELQKKDGHYTRAEGLRHLRADRPLHRRRARLVEPPGARLGQRRPPPGLDDAPSSSSRFPSWSPSSRRS